MNHYTYMEAFTEAVHFANELGDTLRVIAYDYDPIFVTEHRGVRYSVVNNTCTLDEMRFAGYKNARVCRTVEPSIEGV